MTLQEEFEARRGLPYTQILNEVAALTNDVIMPIEGKDLRDVVTVLASGLDHRLQMAEPSELRTGLIRAFNSMSINEFGFNLTDPVVVQLLDLGVSQGLIDVNERLWFYAIATKQVPKYPELKLVDVVGYFEPSKVNNSWFELAETVNRTITFRIKENTLEQTSIVVQMQDVYEDGTFSDWYHATAIHGIKVAKEYSGTLPSNGYPKKLRWMCNYTLNVTVSTK